MIIIFISIIAIFLSCSNGDDDEFALVYVAELDPVNGGRIDGTLTITKTGDLLNIQVMAQNLEPDVVHTQYIHGFNRSSNNSTCPEEDADQNNDGIITRNESLPFFGPILLNLDPFPVSSADGMINYTQDIRLGKNGNPSWSELTSLEDCLVVLYGKTVNGVYDNTIPAACGQIMRH